MAELTYRGARTAPQRQATLLRTGKALPDHRAPVQRKQTHAQAYIDQHHLGIDASYAAVRDYVQDDNRGSDQEKQWRRELRNAWNRKQTGSYHIAMPDSLRPPPSSYTTMETLDDWNSDNEDGMDLEKFKNDRGQGTVDLVRSAGIPDKSGVSQLGFWDAIRLGRQVVKTDAYQQIPIVTDIGGHMIEYDNPGTRDIYATPLEESKLQPKSKPIGKMRRFKRSGTSSEFNWATLAKNLDQENYKMPHREQRRLFKFFLKKQLKMRIDASKAEAMAAIGSDLMKGSHGGRHFLHQALKALKAARRSKLAVTFHDLFVGSGSKGPLYAPAAEKGRGKVTRMHQLIEADANLLLGVNNCLINAVSMAGLGRDATIGELIRIRERLQNYGEMLLASPQVVQLIRVVLGIHNQIQVVYQDRIPEDFPGAGAPLTIYHVNGNHFTHVPPDGH
jgi:hypothetical protein